MVDVDRIPGMKSGSRWRNVLVGIVIVVVILVAIGAIVGPVDDEENGDTATDGGTPTTAPPTTATQGTTAPATTAAPTTAESTPTTAPPTTVAGIPPSEDTELPSIRDAPNYYDPDAATITGSGQEVTDVVAEGPGLFVFDYSHEGDRNFIVETFNENSEESGPLMVNRIGPVSGVTGSGFGPAPYSLEVDASAGWELTVAQPSAPEEDIHAPPAHASGNGPSVVGPIRIDGSVTVTGSHEGERNFIVNLINEDADSRFSGTLVFNEIGPVDGAETRVSHSGVAWVVVDASGDWSLEFE